MSVRETERLTFSLQVAVQGGLIVYLLWQILSSSMSPALLFGILPGPLALICATPLHINDVGLYPHAMYPDQTFCNETEPLFAVIMEQPATSLQVSTWRNLNY